MSAQQAAVDTNEITRRVQETHKAITANYVDLAKRYSTLDVDAQSWTTSSATGAAAYVFVYLQVQGSLNFPGGPNLNFLGQGGVLGLGATNQNNIRGCSGWLRSTDSVLAKRVRVDIGPPETIGTDRATIELGSSARRNS